VEVPAISIQLMSIPGLEATQGIAVVRGNATKYLRLLRMFVNSHSEDMKRVQERLAEGDTQGAQRLTHGLKGVSATLGARQVADLASRLDTALHQTAPLTECSELAELCDRELRQLVNDILNLREEVVSLKITDCKFDPEYVKRTLMELETLLAEDNTQASRLVRKSADLLRIKLGSSYAEFTRQIQEFNYDSALEILRRS
jgi:HPt (histidine-containing phosphotransfer) domain-containing protein